MCQFMLSARFYFDKADVIPVFFQARNSSNSTTQNIRQSGFFPEPEQGRWHA